MDIPKLLFEPNKFFEEEIEQEQSILMPFLIIFICGILVAIATFLMLNITLPVMIPEEVMPHDAISFMVYFSSILSIIIVFIMWLIFAGLFHFISYFFEPKGNFIRTLKFTGYGSLPAIFSSIISLVSTYSILPKMENTVRGAAGDPILIEEAMIEVMRDPMMVMSSIFGIIFTIWCIYICAYGIKHAREISLKHAYIVVGIPYSLYIIYLIYGLVMIL